MSRDDIWSEMLLARARAGDAAATEQLMSLLFEELHGLAHGLMQRERADHTLQATALVNEAYVRLFDQDAAWEGRQHFLAIAATVMRRVLGDYARRRRAEKRGGGWDRVSLHERVDAQAEPPVDLVGLDAALTRLQGLHERQARIVEMRTLAGMTVDQVAQALGVSRSTVEAEWRGARAWLKRELSRSAEA